MATPEMIHVGISRFHAILAVIDEAIEKNNPNLEDQLVMSYAIGEMTYAAETLHAILVDVISDTIKDLSTEDMVNFLMEVKGHRSRPKYEDRIRSINPAVAGDWRRNL